MPKKTTKKITEEVEKVLEELKDEGVTESFIPVEVFCKHQNQADNNGVITCNDCGITLIK